MIITAVKPTRQSRVALLTDSGEEFLVDKATWEESPFGVDSSLSREELEELLVASQRRRAKNKAIYLLSKRDYSRKELEQKLCREKGKYIAENREAAAEAAAAMEEYGYVNDEAYAKRMARRLCLEKCYPHRRAEQALCEKGIARATAAEAVAAVDVKDWQLALEFLQKKRYTVSNSPEQKGRMAAAMARYGFSYEDIYRAMAAFAEDENND
jgi:regulatory protein